MDVLKVRPSPSWVGRFDQGWDVIHGRRQSAVAQLSGREVSGPLRSGARNAGIICNRCPEAAGVKCLVLLEEINDTDR